MPTATQIANLRCEYLVDPLGIDETTPRLSWVMLTNRRGARQVAYRVCVASSVEQLDSDEPDLWDSGRRESDRSAHIEYAGQALQSRMHCYWQVTIWGEDGSIVTSAPAHWSMGLLDSADWQANWITHDPEIVGRDPEATQPTSTEPGTPPLFRKPFEISGAFSRTTLYATARGILDLSLNGQCVTPDKFLPEWTDYHKRLHYRTYDVTHLLDVGPNVLGAVLGDGWWSGFIGWQETRGQYGSLENSLLLQLEIELASGETMRVSSDSTWNCETGPILSSDFMLGERYDARREQAGWNQPGFDDSAWLPAVQVESPKIYIPEFGFSNNVPQATTDELPLVAQRSEPVRLVETIQPISVSEATPQTFIYDLGQNIAGWVELEVTGPAGTCVRLRHGERLNPDGTLYTENLRRADATDEYILKGDGVETWSPRFTFHGFQYVEVTGLDAPIALDKLRGCVVMSATEATGEFECSHPLVNRLWSNALWGQKGNFLSVPTDCPQRDERLGWMGDAQVFLRTATCNMDVAAFFTKWMVDVCDSQDVDGIFPDVAPRLREGDNFIGLDGLGGSAGWGDAGVIIPWTMWRVYGDNRIIERHWNSMVKWLDWLEKTNPDGIRSNELGNNYGDWLCIPSDTTFRTHSEMKTLLATAYWADDAAKMAVMANLLGKPAEAERFQSIAARIRNAFQNRWLVADGRLTVNTQTAYLLALAFDMLPAEVRASAANHLVENIQQLDGHLSTGFIGISLLNPVLSAWGHSEVAYQLLCNEDYPSWLYPILHGATTIWERWNGWTKEDGFFDPQMNSFNHYSLGSVSEWLTRCVAGIELDPAVPGFKQFVIKPEINPRLTYAEAHFRSIYGTIESRWELDNDTLRLNITVPANTRAEVHIPCNDESNLREGGRLLNESEGVSTIKHVNNHAVLQVESGRFEFEALGIQIE